MNNTDFDVPKLKVFEVISEAIRLYKENYKLFIKITAMAFLINLLNSTLDLIRNFLKNPVIAVVYMLLVFIVSLVLFYFSVKFTIATYAIALERYRGRSIDVKSSLSIAAQKFWRYIGTSIMLALTMFIPAFISAGLFVFVENEIVKWAVIAPFAILGICIGTIYNFAPLIVIAENEKKKYFAMSKNLVSGDLLKVIFLTLIVTVAFSVPFILFMYVFNDYRSLSPLFKYIAVLINQFLFIFIRPFTCSVYAVLYYKLKEIKTGWHH